MPDDESDEAAWLRGYDAGVKRRGELRLRDTTLTENDETDTREGT